MDLLDAVRKNNTKKVTKFLEEGADPNFVEDSDNLTPLHFAVVYNAKNVIPLLIEAGANLNAKNYDGLTPLEIALELKNEEMVDLLSQ
jgi:ankyrin repeat protein